MFYARGSEGATQRTCVPPDHSMEIFHETSFNYVNPRYGDNDPPPMDGPGPRNYLGPEQQPQRDSIQDTPGKGRPEADTRDPNNRIYEFSKQHVAKVGKMKDEQQQKFPVVASKLDVPWEACEEAHRQYRNIGQHSEAMVITDQTEVGREEAFTEIL